MALEIIEAGILTTLQDLGREGYGSMGYRRSGACDKYALRMANVLAGNWEEDTLAALEFTLTGGKIRFTHDEVFALTGANAGPLLDGRPVPMFCPVAVRAGQMLKLSALSGGLRTYLAVNGGFRVKPVMGSISTDVDCALGGLEGRALKAEDVLYTNGPDRHYYRGTAGRETELALGEGLESLRIPSYPYRCVGRELLPVMRMVPGPQAEMFAEQSLDTLARGVYTVTEQSNRMASKLSGPVLKSRAGSDILSDGIVEGSVQVAANGLPMVMLADHQTTGGYAKIGTVISTDIPALAQRRPGEHIGFCFITPEEARAAYQKEERKRTWVKERIVTRLKNRRRFAG